MPRANAFTRADIARRDQATEADFNLAAKIEKILSSAAIPKPALKQIMFEVKQAMKTYNLHVLADSQERPAAMVAALKPGLMFTKQLRK